MSNISPLLLAAIAVFGGCLIDVTVKLVALELSVLTLTLWRFAFGTLIAVPIYVFSKLPVPSLEATRFHTMRAVINVIAALSFFYGLTQLGLAEATVLGFTAALMVAPIAWIILKERLTAFSVGAAMIGFVGAVIAVSGETAGAPAEGNRLYGIVSVLIAAVAYAITLVLLRMRAMKEDALTIVMFSNLLPAAVMVVIVAAVAAVSGTNHFTLPVRMIPWMAGLGALGMSVWWVFTIAYGRAPAQRLAPLEYLSLLWSAGLGFIVFREVPSWQLYVGSVVIIGACLLVAAEQRFVTRREARSPVGDILD